MLVVIAILLFIIACAVAPEVMAFLVIGTFKLALALIALALVGGGIYWLYLNFGDLGDWWYGISHDLDAVAHIIMLVIKTLGFFGLLALFAAPFRKEEPWRKNRI